MKKLLTLLLTAVLAFTCCGVIVFADGDYGPYPDAESLAQERVGYMAISNADFPLYCAMDQDGHLIYIYAEPNEETVLSGLQAEFERCGVGAFDPKDFIQCVDMIRYPYVIKSYLDNYVIGTHKNQLHHIYIEAAGETVKLHYDTGTTDEAELTAVRNCIAEQYFDESVIQFCPENLITDVYAICELIKQFTEDQNFDEYLELDGGIRVNGFSVIVCFEYGYVAEAAKPLFNSFMEANSIDRSKVVVTGVLEDSGEKTIRLRGNIDGDDEVTCIDAQLVLRNALDLMLDSETEKIDGADIDGDGEITSLDAQYILLYYLNNTVIEKPVMWKDIIP